jgi:hypothetical protein
MKAANAASENDMHPILRTTLTILFGVVCTILVIAASAEDIDRGHDPQFACSGVMKTTSGVVE